MVVLIIRFYRLIAQSRLTSEKN